MTAPLEFAFLPRRSPGGSQIAFTVGVDEDNFHIRLSIVDSDGGNDRFLTVSQQEASSPTGTPDGDRIAFLGFHSGRVQPRRGRADGTGLAQVTSSRVDEAWLELVAVSLMSPERSVTDVPGHHR